MHHRESWFFSDRMNTCARQLHTPTLRGSGCRRLVIPKSPGQVGEAALKTRFHTLIQKAMTDPRFILTVSTLEFLTTLSTDMISIFSSAFKVQQHAERISTPVPRKFSVHRIHPKF
jgi:hypothetical protein